MTGVRQRLGGNALDGELLLEVSENLGRGNTVMWPGAGPSGASWNDRGNWTLREGPPAVTSGTGADDKQKPDQGAAPGAVP